MRTRTLFFALSVSALSFLGVANAQTTLTPAQVNVVLVNSDLTRDNKTQPLPPLNAETEQQAQAEIEANPSLKSILEGQNVELKNVVGIQTAADGGKIVYVK